MVAPPKIKHTVNTSLHLLPRAAHQLHMSPPYYHEAQSSSLPARIAANWKCWAPCSATKWFAPHELVPCPPRITLAGLLQERKRHPVPPRHSDKVHRDRENLVASLQEPPKQSRHFSGKRARNKRRLQFPVPANRPANIVKEGKRFSPFPGATYFFILFGDSSA